MSLEEPQPPFCILKSSFNSEENIHPPRCFFFLFIFLRERLFFKPQRQGNLQLQLHFLHFTPPPHFLKDLPERTFLRERRLRVNGIIV